MLVQVIEAPPVLTAWQYLGGDPLTDTSTPEFIKLIVTYTHGWWGERLYVDRNNNEFGHSKEVLYGDWILSKKDKTCDVLTNIHFQEKYKVVEDKDGNIS